jgi:predicted secreted protein
MRYCILLIFACLATAPALADEAKPTVEDVTAQANALISAVRSQRDSCNDQTAQLAVQIDKLTKELAALKKPVEPKKEPLK